MKVFFAAIVEADPAGGYGVEVVGTGVNGQGESKVEALSEAGDILQEVIWDAVDRGEALPEPGTPSAHDMARGEVALLQVTLPAMAAE